MNPSKPSGGPYPPTTAGVGGSPTVTTDIPICAVLLVIYLAFAGTNQTHFRHNLREHHKFIPSIALFGFCMARVATLVLRIAWATRQRNIRLAIAANVFVNAGVLIVYIINLILAQRILRAKQPHLGWNPIVRSVVKVLYVLIPGALAMVITSVVVTVYTLNPHTRAQCRDIQLAAITYLLIFNCVAPLHLAAAWFLPRSENEETFGTGTMRSKFVILGVSCSLCVLIAGFKAGTTWSPPRPIMDPAWYDGKPAFYIFNFVCEVLALATLTISRIDRRFWVPNGCMKAGDYTRLREEGLVEEVKEKPGESEKV